MGQSFEIIVASIVFLILGWLLFHKLKWGSESLSKFWLWTLYSVKVLAGIALIAVYTFYHTDRSTADIFKYYDDAQIIQQQTSSDFASRWSLILGFPLSDSLDTKYTKGTKNWQEKDESWKDFSKTSDFNFFNSNRFITRIHLLLFPLTAQNIFLHSLFFSLISLWGGLMFFKLFAYQKIVSKTIAIVLVFLLPSTLLWCSGMLKDTITLAAVEVGIYLIVSQAFKVKFWLKFLPLVIVLALCKYYVLPALLIFMLFHFFNHLKFPIWKNIVITLITVFTVCLLPYFFEELPNVILVLNAKRAESLKIAVMGDAKDYVFYHFGQLDAISLLKDFTFSIYSSLLYPSFPNQTENKFGLMFMFENWMLWIFAIYFTYRNLKSRLIWTSLTWSIMLFTLVLAIIIGYTTPVTGGLLRYKTAFWSLLFVGLIVGWERKRIKN